MEKRISAVVLTHNDEARISHCLEALSWADEVIVVDDDSWDRTVMLAEKSGAKVLRRSLDGDFAAQRNFGLAQAGGEWVLFVDSDENVPRELAEEIRKATVGSFYNGYFLRRRDCLFGRKLRFGETASVRLLRLGRKAKGRFTGPVHETWQITGPVSGLSYPLEHFPHQTISEFVDEVNRYSTLRARDLFRQGVRVSGWELVFYPLGKFLRNYFWRQGFRDGMPGLVVAVLMSFHSFLVRGKLYLQQQNHV